MADQPYHEHEHEHDHEHDHDELPGLRIGLRILKQDDAYYAVEADISPYVDAPEELGVSLVFFPLEGLNPLDLDDDWPVWSLDIDDELDFREGASVEEQFAYLVPQLHALNDARLLESLQQAREQAEEEG